MHVLIVDDDANLRKSIGDYLKSENIVCSAAENGHSAQRLLGERSFDCIITDLKMPGMSGLDLLDWVKDYGIRTPVIMISAYGQVEDAVYALKHGAAEYLVKPFDPDELLIRLKRVVEEQQLRQKVESISRQEDTVWWSESPSMRSINTLIEKAAPTSSTVLITGASGTGKEVVARRIHQLSSFAAGPFVPVNMGGVPENLLESELFGYEKGAFTGAEQTKVGLFESASRGTLFLDEIGDMPLHLQVKLLRVLQDQKIQRLGSTRTLPIDVRIIAATNSKLEELVKSGQFRDDLYYRLNVIRIELPPLKERNEDLPDLVSHFLRRLSEKVGKTVSSLSSEALEAIKAYSFPGNIRELENILERAVILAESDSIQIADLGIGPESKGGAQKSKPRGTLKEIERQVIQEALQRWEGKRQAVADELGINRRTLLNKMKEYGL